MKCYVICFLCFLVACTQPEKKQATGQPVVTKPIDTSRYAILKFDTTLANRMYIYRKPIFDINAKPALISEQEIERINYLMSPKIVEYNKTLTKEQGQHPLFNQTIKYPSKYYVQLIAVININGQKEVFVNCICKRGAGSQWKKRISLADDGGSCFFHLYVNLTTNTVRDFKVNEAGG
jgi:hypothetical protein